MPGRNINKIYVEHGFYHLYSRGVDKQRIFYEPEDYAVFLNLFKRYLSDTPVKDAKGRPYPWLAEDIELLSFCLMPNHIHALIYQLKPQAMTVLLKGVMTTYGMYFNKKYKRVGPLFQSRFRASMITSDHYLEHISRYIHLNPKAYTKWPYSSLPYFTGTQSASWVKPARILSLFDNDIAAYTSFLADYEDYKAMLDELKYELANDQP